MLTVCSKQGVEESCSGSRLATNKVETVRLSEQWGLEQASQGNSRSRMANTPLACEGMFWGIVPREGKRDGLI